MKWIKEVQDYIETIAFELNDYKTRTKVFNAIHDILRKHEVQGGLVDCSTAMNNAEVVNNGDFKASVKIGKVTVIFSFK
jgi:hypothetical protein